MGLLYNKIRERAIECPHKVAIEKGDGQGVTYLALLESTHRILTYFVRNKITPLTRLAVLSEQNDLLIPLYLAASRAGVTLVFLMDLADPTTSEFTQLINEASPDFVLLGNAHVGKRALIQPLLPVAIVDDLIREEPIDTTQLEQHENAVFLQAYTSGTTSRSKAVCLT